MLFVEGRHGGGRVPLLHSTLLLGCSGMVLPAAGDIPSLRIGAPSTPFLYQTLFLHIPTGHLRHPPLSVLCERKSLSFLSWRPVFHIPPLKADASAVFVSVPSEKLFAGGSMLDDVARLLARQLLP